MRTGRPRVISENDLLLLINRFYLERRDKFIHKPKFSDIGDYIRENGYEIDDRIIRRNQNARNRIDELEKENISSHAIKVSIYHTINVDEILENNSKERIKTIFKEREQYYMSLANSAAEIFKREFEFQEEKENLLRKCQELESDLIQERDKNYKEQIKELKQTINKQRRIIDTYLFPDVANKLLKDEGLIKTDCKFVDENSIDNIANDNTNIKQFNNDIINKMASKVK